MSAREQQYGGSHYKKMNIQPWDVIDSWPQSQQIGFYRGNALKYLMRAGSKDDPMQEIQKARHYLDKLIELLGEKNDSRIFTISGLAKGSRQVHADEFGRKQNETGCDSFGGSSQAEPDPQEPSQL